MTHLRFASALLGLSVLLACGGGGGGGGAPLSAPHITSFMGRPTMILSGSSATLSAVFEQGAGSLDHGLGSVISGADVSTGALMDTTTYTLTVTGPSGGIATATASIAVANLTARTLQSARSYHAAARLPNGKVLITGGLNASGALNKAELFDPISRTFTVASDMQQARMGHTATLLPNGSVLVVGGARGANVYSSAETYSGSFAPTVNNLSTARCNHTATLLPNGKVLIAGGEDSASSPLGSAQLYDTHTFLFGDTSIMTTARRGHTATLLPNGKVLFTGGFDGTNGLATAELYDPWLNAFVATGAMHETRTGHAATLLPNGKVLITGGQGNGRPVVAELYDPSTGQFSFAASMNASRLHHTATLLPNGEVLIAGGSLDDSKALELYDPDANGFTLLGKMVTARDSHTATVLGDGRVLLAGGRDGSQYVATGELFDPQDPAPGHFRSTGSMNVARTNHTMTLLPDGHVLVAGGQSGGQYWANAERHGSATGQFSPAGSMTEARSGHAATLLPNGKVLLTGGRGPGYLSSAELYDPAAGTFTATGSMSVARYGHTATLLPTGKVLVVGGANASGFLSTVELYDPAVGTFAPTGGLNMTRAFHTATPLFHGASGEVLITGGVSSVALASMEVYDVWSGTFAPVSHLDTGRQTHVAISLPTGTVFIAGGQGNAGSLQVSLPSAEAYDPATHSTTLLASMNMSRSSPAAVLLPTGKVLVTGGWEGTRLLSTPLASAEVYDPAMGAVGTFLWTGAMGTPRYGHAALLLPTGQVLVTGGNGRGSEALASAELYQ